jgi:hypothetical protein
MEKPERQAFGGEEDGAGYAPPVLDLIAAAALVALAGWYVWEAFGFRAPGGWKTAPALAPIAAGVSLMLMAIVLALTAWRRRGQPEAAETAAAAEDTIADPGRTALLVGIVFAYILALDAIPFSAAGYVAGRYVAAGSFEIATVLCLCAMMRAFWDGRLATILLIAAGWTAILSLVFRLVFAIHLPT